MGAASRRERSGVMDQRHPVERAIIVACQLADEAPAGEVFVTAATDQEAGLIGEAFEYEEYATKAGPTRIRRLIPD